ncbi:uncharacterized protein A4U43_C02F12140 [Asparagus officinalis]|uniref:Sulfotransferase n=1 Tax=Asparagus officinalis TaxID=4686 RepID=A0A5P1FHN7_ASPOF|nr:uncharacterized protein A4U43_C02F12140 [Asparagus officinalis]
MRASKGGRPLSRRGGERLGAVAETRKGGGERRVGDRGLGGSRFDMAGDRASLERPKEVVFTKHEDFKKDPKAELKRSAEFTGYPFTIDGKNHGVVERIIALCSFEYQKTLEVNKKSKSRVEGLHRSMLFQAWDNWRLDELPYTGDGSADG